LVGNLGSTMKTCSIFWSFVIVFLAIGVGYFIFEQYETNEMYANWKASNSLLNLKGKNVLVVGGTQGIGAGVARRFAQLGASVSIAGRNEKLANELIETMKKEQKDSSQEFSFRRVDTSLVQDVARFTDEALKYYSERGGLHYLIQSQGILTYAKVDTTEGLDNNFALSAYSKWMITKRLLPVLKDTTIYILAPASAGELDFSDVECRNKSIAQTFKRNGIFIDAITKEFQKRNENLRFYHLFPGIVKTDLLGNSGFNVVLNSLVRMFTSFVGREAIVYADHPVYVATHPSEIKVGGLRLNEKGQEYPLYDWIENQENRAKLFQWSEEQEAKILKS